MSQTFYGLELKHRVPGGDGHVDDDPIEITFVENGDNGDLKLEQGPDGIDPDTLVMIDGEAYDFSFDMTATLPTEKKDGARQIPEELQGEPVAVITIMDYPDEGDETQIMFLPFTEVDEDLMEEFGKRHFDFQDIDADPDPIPVCFVAGTLIDTPDGPKPVETLQAGDLVSLPNGGTAALKMVARSHFSYAQMLLNPDLRPVCIPAGSLGGGHPSSDLWVSQQHRIALRGWQVELLTTVDAAFAKAKHLVPSIGIPGPEWREGVTYVHLLFDRHEIVIANGAEAESLFLGEQAVASLDEVTRGFVRRLHALDPDVYARFAETALPTMKAHEAKIWAKLAAGQPVFRDLVRAA